MSARHALEPAGSGAVIHDADVRADLLEDLERERPGYGWPPLSLSRSSTVAVGS